MRRFEYLEPRTLDEAIVLLGKYQDKAQLLAGGTDLLVELKYKRQAPEYLINIKKIPEMACVDYSDTEGLRLGPLTTFTDLEHSPIIREKYPVLVQAASLVGSPQIRNVGTVGGNLCHASPSAEMAPSLIGLGAKVKIADGGGEREILLEEFFLGPGRTALQPSGVLVEIRVPCPRPGAEAVYLKHCVRRAVDIAIVGVAAVVTPGADLTCESVRIVLGAVAPVPMRAKGAESVVQGRTLSIVLAEEAAAKAMEEARPISDVRASAEYRRHVVGVLTRRALMKVLDKVTSRN